MLKTVFPRKAPYEVFWGEIAPFEHAVQIYANEQLFLDALEGFVSSGLRENDSILVIATPEHRQALERRLTVRGYALEVARSQDQYIPLDAEATLAHFMVDGRPDEQLFRQTITALIHRARRNGRRVRAFGEMVALLWNMGHGEATIRLEMLWNKVCEDETLCLFCAYPETGFTQDLDRSILEICSQHSRVIRD